MLLFAAIAFEASAQMISYSVTVPAGTKACYIAGDMNGWLQQVMTKVDETHYSISFPSNFITAGYKYCSGPGWAFVERDSAGTDIANRVYSPVDVVKKWASVYDPNGDIMAPTAPTGLKFTPPVDNAFYLSWQAATDNVAVVGYDVFKDSVYYGSSITLGLDITSLAPGKTYKMTVRARDAAGNQSVGSTPLLVTNPGSAGITYNVTVPPGTNMCYFAGAINNWNPTANPMSRQDPNHYTISFPNALATDEYKYCSGPGWSFVEKDSVGGDIDNRVYSPVDVVKKWASVYDPSALPIEKDVLIKVTVHDSVKVCYLAGSFDSWAVPGENNKMTRGLQANGKVVFSKTIHTLDAHTLQYKFCAGPGWEFVQKVEENFIYPANEDSVSVSVDSFWGIYDPDRMGTIKVNAVVPPGTKRAWIMGDFVYWDMAKAIEGTLNLNGTFTFQIPFVQSMQYRLYNNKDWGHPEVGQANPNIELALRSATYPADSITNITVWGWKLSTDSIADLVAPSVPSGLKNTNPTTNSFYLSWQPSTDNVGVVGYDVYKDSIYYGFTQFSGMDISNLTPGKTYKMNVRARDAAGNVSAESSVLFVTTLPDTSTGVTFNVKVPVGTYQCWIAGNFNNWNNNLNQMSKVDSTHYTITLYESTFMPGITKDSLQYKYLSGGGDWAYVEKDSVGGEIPNRLYQANDVVASWNTVYDPNTLPLPMDLTITVTTPAGTNECYIVGNFNNWTGPTAPESKMTKVSTNPDGTVNFKITVHTADANKFVYHFCSGPEWTFEQKSPIGDFKYPFVNAIVTEWKAVYNPINSGLNLLINPSFEDWSSNVPKEWTLTTTVGGVITRSLTTPANSGSAFQIAGPTGTYSISQNVSAPNATTFDTNKTYIVSLKYLTTEGDGTDARIWSGLLTSPADSTVSYYSIPTNHVDSMLYYIPLHGPGGNLNPPAGVSGNDMNGYLLDNRGTNIWHTYSYSFKFPAGIKQFQFQVRTYKAATVIWDDFYFGEIQDSIRDNMAPTIPTGLKNTDPTTNSFYLSWQPSTDNVGVVGYEVYKDSIYYATTTAVGLDITGLTPGTAYKMTVRAKDAAGNLSAASAALIVKTTPDTSNSVIFNVKVPTGTYQCWIVGNFNNWNNNLNQMTRVDSTHYTITLYESTFMPGITKDSLQYKYLSGGGDWIYVEKDSVGGEIPNRRYQANDVVAKWNTVYNPNVLPLPMDLTITVTTPAGTNECYIVGNFNNWAGPTDPGSKMTKVSTNPDGTVLFKISGHTEDANKFVYHFCSGPDWSFEQKSPVGDFKYPDVNVIVTEWKAVYDSLKLGTIKIKATVPAGTQKVWIQGSFLGWDMTKFFEGLKNPDGTFSFSIPNVLKFEYKLYNKPDFNFAEIDETGLERANRTASYPVDSITSITVLGWKQVVDTISNNGIYVQFGTGGTVIENSILLKTGDFINANPGAVKTFTILPNPGYKVESLYYNNLDVKSQLVNNQFTTPTVNGSITLSVTFQKIQYRLSIKSAESGIISLICEYGATPTFEFTPSQNWGINAVMFNGFDITATLANGIFMVPPITEDVTINISFVFQTALYTPSGSNVKVYSTNSDIIIDGLQIGEIVRLFSENGATLKVLKSQGNRMVIPALPDAIYLVKTASKTVKVIL
jgi:chitodextrinase